MTGRLTERPVFALLGRARRMLSWEWRRFTTVRTRFAPQLALGEARPVVTVPLVSLIVTVFNKPVSLVERCIESLLRQTYSRVEIVIVDDGSTDLDLIDYLHRISTSPGFETRMVSLESQRNQGVVAARNCGLARAGGEFIAFVDCDDAFAPTFVEELLAAVLASEDERVAISQCDVAVWPEGDPSKAWIWHTRELEWPLVVQENTAPVSALVRTDVARAIGGVNPAFERGLEDWEFWARLAREGYRSVRVPRPLFIYTHTESGRNVSVNRQNYAETVGELRRSLTEDPLPPPLPQLAQSVPAALAEPAFRIGPRPLALFALESGVRSHGLSSLLGEMVNDFSASGRDCRYLLTASFGGFSEEAGDPGGFPDRPCYDLTAYSSSQQVTSLLGLVLSQAAAATLYCVGSGWALAQASLLREIFPEAQLVVTAVIADPGRPARETLRQLNSVDAVITPSEAVSDSLRRFVPRRTIVSPWKPGGEAVGK